MLSEKFLRQVPLPPDLKSEEIFQAMKDTVTFADRCELCLGCVNLCPKNAIHMKNERSNELWRHPGVPLAEIIKSNDRTVTK